MFSISWASGLPFVPWHKLALGCVMSYYHRPPCGPLLGCVCVWFPIPSKLAGWPLQVRVVVGRHDDREILPGAPTRRGRYASRRLLRDRFTCTVSRLFTCLTYALPALERLYVIIPPHSIKSTPRMLDILFGGDVPSLREFVLGGGSETSARSHHRYEYAPLASHQSLHC
jgi:hypothetical protein